MTENDIYQNKEKFQNIVDNYKKFSKIEYLDKNKRKHKNKYYCKNKTNLKYYLPLFAKFDADDLSYIRRMRLLSNFKVVLHATEKNLKDCNREDIDKILSFMHSVYNGAKSKSDFIKDIKRIWKVILPEQDEKGRIDNTITPYAVRHLKSKIDKSKEIMKNDRISMKEYEQILGAFGDDPRMQAYISLAFESLGRPQEILYRRIENVELHDNYARIWVTEKGKEGTKFLKCIDSYPYLIRWLNQHPQRNKPKAWLFTNLNAPYNQLTPFNVNKHFKKKFKTLEFNKKFTCYSLKRNGITLRRLRGDSDVSIQHDAGWTSTKQLKTYDKSDQEDSFKIELISRGLIADDGSAKFKPQAKTCVFCGHINGLSMENCENCKRPLDRNRIEQEAKVKDEQIEKLKLQMDNIEKYVAKLHDLETLEKAYKIKINSKN